jgi:hypothetical protein
VTSLGLTYGLIRVVQGRPQWAGEPRLRRDQTQTNGSDHQPQNSKRAHRPCTGQLGGQADPVRLTTTVRGTPVAFWLSVLWWSGSGVWRTSVDVGLGCMRAISSSSQFSSQLPLSVRRRWPTSPSPPTHAQNTCANGPEWAGADLESGHSPWQLLHTGLAPVANLQQQTARNKSATWRWWMRLFVARHAAPRRSQVG